MTTQSQHAVVHLTCWLSGTRRTRTSATRFASVPPVVSTVLSRRTDIVAPSLDKLKYDYYHYYNKRADQIEKNNL